MKSRNTVLCIMAIILFINFLVFKANALILSPEEGRAYRDAFKRK